MFFDRKCEIMKSLIDKIQILPLTLITVILLNFSLVSLAQSERGCEHYSSNEETRYYSHGTILTDSRGNQYRCNDGIWERVNQQIRR